MITKYLLLVNFLVINFSIQAQTETVSIRVDLSKEKAPMKPVWAWFGYDEPNFTYMKDGKKLLSEIAALSPVPVYVRTHNLMTTGDGTPALKWGSTNIYTEDKNGNPIYDWTIVDKIFDTYIERKMKPLAEIGFMPEALSSHPEPYRHHWKPGNPYQEIFTGWCYPPKDYKKWGELVYQWVKHCTEKYGSNEVRSWYWELWNEPNGEHGYWHGTTAEYCKLYDYTADAVKRALPEARIGGPHVTGPSGKGAAMFLRDFIKHCTRDTNYVTGKIGAPLDFIAFHAKGAPRVLNGSVRMNIGQQLRDISKGFEIVSSFPEVKNFPIIIGESDPEGCAACGMATNPENAYRNGTMYSSYTAASFAREYDLVDYFKVNFLGAVSWSFEFENQPWFYGYRDLATNGVDKPVLNVFRMLGMMSGNRVEVSGNLAYNFMTVRDSSVRGREPDINALACKDKNEATIMVWNYRDDDLPFPDSPVEFKIHSIPAAKVTLTQYRIDKEHSNSYEVWKKMGSPQNPTPEQVSSLEKAGQLQTTGNPESLRVENGEVTVKMELPSKAVSLLKLNW